MTRERKPISEPPLPSLIANAGDLAVISFLQCFTVRSQDPNKLQADAKIAAEFLRYCEDAGVRSIGEIQSQNISAWVERESRALSRENVNRKLGAIRDLFKWLTANGIIPVDPAASVRLPRPPLFTAPTKERPILGPDEVRRLLDSIDASTHSGLRDRALIGLMFYGCTRVGEAVNIKVEDFYTEHGRRWVRLEKKRGVMSCMPCDQTLDQLLVAYINGAGLAADPKSPLFRTVSRTSGNLTQTAMTWSNVDWMACKRAEMAGIGTKIYARHIRIAGITALGKVGDTRRLS